MKVAILDLADLESVGSGHGRRQEVHESETMSGSNHRDQGRRMVGNNAERWFEAARLHCGQRLVANRLVRQRIPDGDHWVARDLLERERLRSEQGMSVRRQEHERLSPEGTHR